MSNSGELYIVATPIGNLEDISLRALRILREVDMIAAEDTRKTIKLLNHYGIKKTLVSYYEHNKAERGDYLVKQLAGGKKIAVVSDAGTPGISDPGEDIIKLAVENSIKVTMIPGPSAVITGLVISGLPTGRFVFEGFLSMNKRVRKERINALRDETRTIVLYEAPHKLIYTLRELYDALGNRKIVLARELTKKFEQVIRCTLEEAVVRFEKEPPRGEFVLIIDGIDKDVLDNEKRTAFSSIPIQEHVESYMKEGMDKKTAMKKAAEDRGVSRREVYNSLLIKE